jgi:uncharacterized protein involved in exopolysaccharide biosynthesis
MYEQAKIEEVRNTPSVLVLDKAVPADRKAKPKASLYALVALVSSTLLGFLIIFTKEMFVKLKVLDPEKYDSILEQLRSDLSRLRLRKK